MNNVTITFEQDGKKAVGKMSIDGNKINFTLDFVPALEAEDMKKPAPAYIKIAFKFIKFLKEETKIDFYLEPVSRSVK